MARAFDITPLDATFGAVITGVRLTDLDDAGWGELHAAWLEYALLVFPGQHLKRDEQIAFARRFGPLEFEMAAISNVRADGSLRVESDNDDMMKILKGNMGWHADSTYMPVQAKGAVFSAEVVPTVGGHTGFADMRAAYDALDEARKARVETLKARHSLHYSQSKLGHVPRRPAGEGPPRDRPQVAADRSPCPRHSRAPGGRVGATARRARQLRLPAAPGLPPPVDRGRRHHLGQPLSAAPGHALGHDPAAGDVAHPAGRRSGERGRARGGLSPRRRAPPGSFGPRRPSGARGPAQATRQVTP